VALLLLLAAPVVARDWVREKNFHVLSIVEEASGDADLKALLRMKVNALHEAATTCGNDGECINGKMRFSEDEIATVAGVLKRMRVNEVPAWENAAHAINHIIDVYGSGKAPKYPTIDSVSFDVKSEAYGKLLHTVVASMAEEHLTSFFEPSLRYALHLLDINHRDEAGRFEPLEKTVNADVLRRIKRIQWDKYPYSVIVVPGYGPEKTDWALAPEGKLRIELAARRFREHKAPLILVSGGYVHPNQTPYCEAMEMKKSLVVDFGVPADAIIVEPHARHTTTNLRNAARLMHKYGIPFGHKALITTDSFQSSYIESDAFAKRCEQDFGYQPAKLGKRTSEFDLEFVPRIESLQIDPMDPLDP
jgi:hypothetical protein